MPRDTYTIEAPDPRDHPGEDINTIYEIHKNGRSMATVQIDYSNADFLASDLAAALQHIKSDRLSDKPVRHFPVAFVLTCDDLRGMEERDVFDPGMDPPVDFDELTDDECHQIGRHVHKCADWINGEIWEAVEQVIADFYTTPSP